jgi:hypothetical protein
MSPVSLPVGLAVLGALAPANLCAGCSARRAGLPLLVAIAELAPMNSTRTARGWAPLGRVDAYCLRCEAPRPVYRLLRS